MKLLEFQADADIVGRRVRVSWRFVPEGNETLANIPRVTLRRKTRDFEFPPVGPGDPMVVYASDAFPPTGTMLTELNGWEYRLGESRVRVTVDSASTTSELLRRTVSTTYGPDGLPQDQRVEVLDIGLEPGTTYYYEIYRPQIGPDADPWPYRATAAPTEAFRLSKPLYESLPAIYRRHDVARRPETPGTGSVPEEATGSGQLRRLTDVFGAGLDSLRGSAEGLRSLHDVDSVDYRYLPLLATWVGWELSDDAPIPLQRHEVRYAAQLYRVTGTIPGCVAWVKRLTGWTCRVKEFYPNVFFSNAAARTVNTADAGLLSRIGTPDDDLNYSYDTGTSDHDWYAYNVVGLFIEPPSDEPASDITRKRERLRRSLPIFMPVNVRGVVILRAPTLVEPPVDDQFDFRGPIIEGGAG